MDGEPRRVLEARAAWRRLWELAADQQGAVERARLFAEGVRRGQLDSWVAGGRLVIVHRGVYLVACPVEPPLARHSAALLSCGPRSAVGGWHAAELSTLPLGPDAPTAGTPIDIRLAGPHRSARTGVRIHHTRDLPESDIVEIEGLRVTSAARTICDLAPEATPRRLERMIAEALYLKLFGEDEFTRRVNDRRFSGAPKLRALMDDGPRMTRSEGESILGAHLDAASLPRARTQYKVRGCEFDFVWPRERVVLELDRASAHARTRTKQRDDHKSLVLVEAGWPPPLHVTGSRLRREPERIVTAIAGAVAKANPA